MISEVDLLEAHAAGRALKSGEIDRFAAKENQPLRRSNCPQPLRADHVMYGSHGSFAFARDTHYDGAKQAFTIIATTAYGAIDIAAWQPATNQVGLWLNRAFALGEEQIWAPRLGDEPLPIWRTPLNWLRAGRKGIVILRPEVACLQLDCVSRVSAEDLAHAEALERILLPPKPKTKIYLPDNAQPADRSVAA